MNSDQQGLSSISVELSYLSFGEYFPQKYSIIFILLAFDYLYRMVFKGLFGSIVLLLIMSSCMIEEVSSFGLQRLVIGSDYLEPEDSILFKAFTQSTGINVIIESKSGKELYNQIKNNPENCGIDLLMISSETQLHKFSTANYLQALDERDSLSLGIPKFTSYKYNYVGYALDPFVISTSKDSRSIRTYNDLTHNKFINALSKNEAICLLAPVSRKIPKGKAQEWVEAFYAQSLSKSSLTDSLIAITPKLSLRSNLLKTGGNSRTNESHILKSGNAGSFYSLKTFAIVRQCENYIEAKELISYFSQPSKNKYLVNHLHFVSIHNPESVFRPYKIPTEDLFQYYTLIGRWLDKLGVE